MSQIRTTGLGGLLSAYGVLCLFLGFMVFAWGTNYKLSLYKAKPESSPAKVCTRGADAAKNALDHAAGNSAVAHTPLSIAIHFSPLLGIEDYSFGWQNDEAVSDISPLSRAPILYLRPPPDERRTFD